MINIIVDVYLRYFFARELVNALRLKRLQNEALLFTKDQFRICADLLVEHMKQFPFFYVDAVELCFLTLVPDNCKNNMAMTV